MRLLPFSLRLQFSNNRLSTIFGVHSYTRHSCPPHYQPTIFHIHMSENHAHRGEWAYRISNMYNKCVRAARAADQSGRSPGHVDLQSMKASLGSCTAPLGFRRGWLQTVVQTSYVLHVLLYLSFLALYCSSCLPDLAMCLPFY